MSEEAKNESEGTIVSESQVQRQEPAEEPRKKVAPRIFFNKDSRIEVSVNGYHNNETGELAFAVPAENEATIDTENTFGELFTKVNYKFWFTRCTYDKYNRYRTRSLTYNIEDKTNTINEVRLREFFLVFHLVDWNLTDEDGKKIELKFDPNKSLSDESLDLIYTLPSMLLDVVLATYERKMSL